MKTRKLFVLPAICCALALTLGAYGEEKQENAKAKAEAEENAKLIFSEDGKTITRVKDKSIKSVVIPNGVTHIGYRAFSFSDCSSLTSITIPDSVTSIGERAFSDCSSLTRITIPDSVTSIGGRAFSGCSSLTRITIPAKFTDDDVKKWDLSSRCKIIRR